MTLQKMLLASLLMLPFAANAQGQSQATAKVAVQAPAAAAYQVTTQSGLQYTDVVVGTGPAADIGSKVTVHYTGTLEDGTKFDSSRDRGKPFSFTLGLGDVIEGWEEGVLGMKAGGRRLLHIPPKLGYGARKTGPIPANSPLVFDIELLEVK
jgi:peptidylprolyl isomerase